jgi:integrase
MARPQPANPFGPAEVYSEETVRALIKGCNPRCASGARNRSLILLLWTSGLRIGEALALRPSDIRLDAAEPVVEVSKGKTGQRTVGLHPEAGEAIRRWLEIRRACKCDEKRPARAPQRLFCTLAGRELKQSYIRTLLRRLGRKAGLKNESGGWLRIHPHGFRATLAVELLKEGQNIGDLRDVLGHSSIAVSDQYLRRLGAGSATRAVINRRPGGGITPSPVLELVPQPRPRDELRELLDGMSAEELRDALAGAVARAA